MARRPGDEAHLIDEYARLLEQNPQSPLFLALARLYRRAGMSERAEEILRKGLELQPHFAEARVALGALLAERERWEEARGELEQAVKHAPHNLAAHRLLARCYDRAGDGERAALAAETLSLLDPRVSALAAPPCGEAVEAGVGAPAVAAPDVLREGGEEKLPAEAGVEAEEEPAAGEPLPTEALAELYLRQGHRAEAIGVYRELLGREPGNERYRARLEELEGGAGEEPGDLRIMPSGVELAGDLESILAGEEPPPHPAPSGAVESLLGEEPVEAPPSLEAGPASTLELLPASRDAEEEVLSLALPSGEETKGVTLGEEFERTVEMLANLYLEDGLMDRALDLYKRARSLHPESPALAARMEALEGELAGVASGAALAGEMGAGALEEVGPEGMAIVPLDAESRARVIGELERWLEALERRRARGPEAASGLS